MGGLWRAITQRLTRVRWPLAGLAALVVVLACVLVVPQWLVRWELGASARTLTATDRAKAINDVRGTLLQGIGGLLLLAGAFATWRQVHVSREGQITERFTRATDQLGHADLSVRLGGIYALERIANDSPEDRATIAEVLTAFVRGHAPWPPRPETQPPAGATIAEVLTAFVRGHAPSPPRPETQPSADTPIEQVPELQVRALDVQAALTVLARRRPPPTPSGRLDLHATDLRKALLYRANLQGANLSHAGLQGANLVRAQLQNAILIRAGLSGADLKDANLEEANVERAMLEGANLTRTKLHKAILRKSNLKGANLRNAELQGAILSVAKLINARLNQAKLQKATLWGADLQEANLKGAQLQEAILEDAHLQKATLTGADFREANLTGAQLQDAYADPTTKWPVGFDSNKAGIVLDPYTNTTGEPES